MLSNKLAGPCAWGMGVLLAATAGATIDDRGFPDVRGTGMGGADSAVVEGAAAVTANPAALGFMARSNRQEQFDNLGYSEQSFEWSVLDAGVAGSLTGDLGTYLEVLANVDFARFEAAALQQPENIRSLLSLAGAVGSISDQDTVVLNAQAGSMVQIGRFGTGFRMYGQIGGWINDLDLVNLGLQLAASEIADELEDALASDPDFDPTGYAYQTFDAENVQKIREAFGAGVVSDDALAYLDYKTAELVGDRELNRDRISSTVEILASIVEASEVGNELTNNTSSVTGRGFIAAEIPVSCGYALNDHVSVGLSVRAIFGRVYGTQVWAFNDDNDSILEDSLESSADRFNVGLDAAVMYRIPHAQFALTGSNLNAPTFDGYEQDVQINGIPRTVSVPRVRLDPQLTLGGAWIPHRRLIIGSDIELLETGTLLNGYDVQRLSFGSEVDLSLVQLRLGTYKNMAESDIGWVLTGGLGFQLWALSAEVAAAVSIDDTVEYDGVNYPRTARLNLGVSMDF